MAGTIHEAILEVMRQVGYVQKQRTQGLNYTYAGERALIAAIRPAMVEAGIYCHVVELRRVERGTYATSRGGEMQTTLVEAVVRFTHAPSGTWVDTVITGEGADVGDKSANKAMTGAYKYALRQTFCIETGDDPDDSASEPRAPRQQSAAAARCETHGTPLERRSNGELACRACFAEQRAAKPEQAA